MIDLGVPADTFELRGKGTAFSFYGIPDFNPRPLLGQDVMIDGKPYLVKGVDTFAIYDVTGLGFALLVEPIKDETD